MWFSNLFKKKEKKVSQYLINENDIVKHSEVIFNLLMEFYSDVRKITESFNLPDFHKEIIRSIEDDLGVGPGSEYNIDLLKNDNFRIMVIYTLGVSNAIGYYPSFSSYNFYKQMIDKILNDSKDLTSISNDSTMIKSFNVDPSSLPISYKQFIAMVDEFTIATNTIVKSLSSVKGINSYQTYDEYYEYINSEAIKIINELHTMGLFNTHEERRFTALCLSHVCKFPTLDTLYKKPSNNRVVDNVKDIPTDAIVGIQKQLFEIVAGLGFGDDNN